MKTALIERIRQLWRSYDRMTRYASVDLLEWELKELENIFSLILFGFAVGLPSAPTPLMLDILPLMEEEIATVMERVGAAHDPLGELFSLLEIG